MKKFVYRTLTVSVALFALTFVGCGWLDKFSRINTYFPSKDVPVHNAFGAYEVWMDVAATDKIEAGKINALWLAQQDRSAPSMLYLHGNGGNIYTDMQRIKAIYEAGFSVLAIDYRGYGKSSGDLPDEEALYADARAGWKRLALLSPNASKRLVYGHSLGGAVAVWLASVESGIDGLVVESSFTSLYDVAQNTNFRFLPLTYMLTQKYPSVERIAALKMHKLIIHGKLDKTVPFSLGVSLYTAASEPKMWLSVEGAGHNDAYAASGKAWVEELRKMGGIR